MLEIMYKRQARLEKKYNDYLGSNRISYKAASSVARDKPMTVTLAEVDDSSDAQYS